MKGETLFSSGLLNKYGFSDGDLLDEFLEEFDPENIVIGQEFLVRVVETSLLPRLRENHKIVVQRISTIHNPIRLVEVDGKSIFGADDEDWKSTALTPESVSVSGDELERIARAMVREQEDEQQ